MPRKKHGGGGKPSSKRTSLRHETVQVLGPSELNITREIEHIRECAVRGECHTVRIRGLVLFSTPEGDAWILDPEDNLALCLMQDYQRQEVYIREDDRRFEIGWNAHFGLDGDVFATISEEKVTFWPSYPAEEIRRAIDLCMRTAPP